MLPLQNVAVFLAGLLASICLHAQEERGDDERRITTPADIVSLIERSATTYQVHVMPADSVDRIALDILFPRVYPRIAFPVLLEHDGEPEVTEYPFDSVEAALFMEAEERFAASEFDHAYVLYQDLLKRYPGCYVAVGNIGDCYYRQRDFAAALRYFDSAIGMNPIDPQFYFYRGDALRKMGRMDEAVESYIDALVYLPHYPIMIVGLNAIADSTGIEIRDGLFAPKGFARRDGDGIEIGVANDAMSAGWLMYAMTKAAWLGEPEHRMQAGVASPGWSTREESEALSMLVMSYLANKQEDTEVSDPQSEMLFRLTMNRQLLPFILYEIGARIDPHIMGRVPEEVRNGVREYVRRYVVVRNDR